MSRALSPKNADERQHPERMQQVRERLGRVVGLDDPPEVHAERLTGLEQVRRLDEPLAAGRRDEQAEQRRVDADHHRERVRRRDAHEEVRDLRRQPRVREHPHDSGVHRVLNQHAADRSHGRRDRVDERLRPPVQQHPDDQEQEHVVIEIEHDADALRADLEHEIAEAEHARDDREQRAVLEPLSRPLALADVVRRGRVLDAHLLHRARLALARRRVERDSHRHGDQQAGHQQALPEAERLRERNHAADLLDRVRQRRGRGHDQRGGRR